MKTRKRLLFVMTMACGFLLALACIATSSKAQQVISYQGMVMNNGTPLNVPHNVMLAIYADSTAGTAIYTESQHNVAFTNGLFDIEIGTNKANPLPIFDAGDYSGTVRPAPDYFLGISLDGGAELTPRSKLGASPTAWSSRFADSARVAGSAPGLPSGAIVLFADNGPHPGYSLIGNSSAGGDTWSTGAVLPVGQFNMASAVVNGKIYVIGGQLGSHNNNQIYDPVANTWSTGAVLPVGQEAMTSAVVNGKIYVIGGGNGSGNDNQIYDPAANTWSTGAVLPVGELFPSSAVVNGKIYVMGGRGSNSNQIYDPVADTWTTGAQLPVAQDGKANVVNGKIYVMGGETSPYNNNQIYDPGTNTWTTGKVLPVATYAGTSAVVNGKIYLIGGENGAFTDNQIYDPATDTWSTGASLPVGEDVTGSGVVNGKIYVIGGGQGADNLNQIYSPALTLYYFTKN